MTEFKLDIHPWFNGKNKIVNKCGFGHTHRTDETSQWTIPANEDGVIDFEKAVYKDGTPIYDAEYKVIKHPDYFSPRIPAVNLISIGNNFETVKHIKFTKKHITKSHESKSKFVDEMCFDGSKAIHKFPRHFTTDQKIDALDDAKYMKAYLMEKTKLHRFMALKNYHMHGELHWKDSDKFWQPLSLLSEERYRQVTKNESTAKAWIANLGQRSQELVDIDSLLMSAPPTGRALNDKRYKIGRRFQQGKIYKTKDLLFLQKYLNNRLFAPDSLYNLTYKQMIELLVSIYASNGN